MVKYMVTQEGLDFDDPGNNSGRNTLACGKKYAKNYRLRVDGINED